jgi:hypothetical protein
MANHWEIKCVTCGHRKGSHCMIRNSGQVINGVAGIGQCEVTHPDWCNCKGFTDNKNWKDGKRIKRGNKETTIICINYSKQLLRQPQGAMRPIDYRQVYSHATQRAPSREVDCTR